jgi:hypothetical protein
MTSKPNGEPVVYQVIMSEQTKATLKQLHRQAFARGTGQQFLDALRQIIMHLRNDPLTFGEPLYRLPMLKLAVRQGMIDPLIVDYGVHEDQQLVFLSGFKVLS